MMNYLSIGSIFKKEHLYIEEWLNTHYDLGVQHFYLACNDDPEDWESLTPILKPWVADNLVTLFFRSGEKQQFPYYNWLIKEIAFETEWLACIDIDEFLYSKESKDIKDTISKLDTIGTSAIAVHWLLYGSNGHRQYSSDPVVKRFIKRASEVNPHVKSIVRPRETISLHSNVHCFRVMGNAVDEKGNVLPEEYSLVPGTADRLCVNHYALKSYEECKERRNRPRCDTGETRNFQEFFESHDRNDVEDTYLRDLIYD